MSTPDQRVVAGRYRLRRLLGRGSMGLVWEAYDEFLHRPVAVKEVLLPPGLPEPEADELRERTLREARAIAVVSHPNVITLHDVVREDAEPFVVMEYMPARSLAELLREFGPLDEPRAATVGYAVAAGLAAAHQGGVTHRDVKPGNVLVAGDGRVKLTDFGIARNVSELTITRTGITLGSPAYMAPEVAAGQEVTPAADLWGLGATLFAAVEGRAPYDPDGPVLDTLSKVVHGDVPVPASTGPVGEVIRSLMVKDPAARATLDDVRAKLHPLLLPPGTSLYPASGDEVPTREELAPVAAPAEPAESDAQPAPARLAADPGPLPFRPPPPAAEPAPRRRGRLATALVAMAAVVVLLLAAGGGFALVRVIGGKPVLPPNRAAPATPAGELIDTRGDAGAQGGFVVKVPQGWNKFVEQRVNAQLPDSTRVRFVSPDGVQQLTVERFPGFYPRYVIDRYVAVLGKESPGFADAVTIPVSGGPGPEPPRELTYRTSEGPVNRLTIARLIPTGADLWVVGVTVPTEQSDTARDRLFNVIAPGFKVEG